MFMFSNKWKTLVLALLVVGFFCFLGGVSQVSAARVDTITYRSLDALNPTIFDFEDSSIVPATGYWDDYGLKITSSNGKAIYVNDYNRSGDKTYSGQYSLSNDALWPATSANDPLKISFFEPKKAVGFYLGNAATPIVAKIYVYGSHSELMNVLDVTVAQNAVLTFVGIESTEPIYDISIDYGNTSASEDMDYLMTVPFSLGEDTTTEDTVTDDTTTEVDNSTDDSSVIVYSGKLPVDGRNCVALMSGGKRVSIKNDNRVFYIYEGYSHWFSDEVTYRTWFSKFAGVMSIGQAQFDSYTEAMQICHNNNNTAIREGSFSVWAEAEDRTTTDMLPANNEARADTGRSTTQAQTRTLNNYTRMSCGDSRGDDGLYSLCKGDTLYHTSGVTIYNRAYNNNVAKFSATGLSDTYFRVGLGQTVTKTSNNGDVFSFTYREKDSKYGVFVAVSHGDGTTSVEATVPTQTEIPTTETDTCATLKSGGKRVLAFGDNKVYYAHKGYRYWFPDETTYLSWFNNFAGIKVISVGAMNRYVEGMPVCRNGDSRISEGADTEASATLRAVTPTDNAGTERRTPSTRASEVTNMSCGDSRGNDGLYSACKGDTIYHSSGVTILNRAYDNSVVKLMLTGANQTYARAGLGRSIEVKTADGSKTIKLTYTEKNATNGAFVRIETSAVVTDSTDADVADRPTVNTISLPVVTSPTANQLLTNYPRSARLAWTAVTNATGYNIEVDCDLCGSVRWGSTNKWNSTRNYYTTDPLAGDNEFRVKVRATFRDRSTSDWSDYVYFRYKTPATSVDTNTDTTETNERTETREVRETTETTETETVETAKASWGWKLSTTVDDAHNFINGLGSYTSPHAVQSISANENGFYIFYRNDLVGSNSWGWKLAPTENDAYNFLNMTSAYRGVAKDKADIAYQGDSIYVFYSGTDANATWGWKRSTAIDDMYNYINGSSVYGDPRYGTLGGDSTSDIYMYYRSDKVGNSDWGWKVAYSTEDAYNFLNGLGSYGDPVEEAEVFASDSGFYIFYR